MLAAAASLVSFVALLGRLKTVYYFRSFGISAAEFDWTWSSALFESWYVAQNLVYFTAIVWCVVQTRRFSLALLALFYALIPLSTHYAFLAYDRAWVRFWVDHQHTWLKWIPLALLATVVFRQLRGARLDFRWRHGWAGLALLAVVAGSWGLSAAKHLGSYDAERVLRGDQGLLPAVELTWKEQPPQPPGPATLFLLHETAETVIVVEFSAGPRWERRIPRVRLIPRSELRQLVISPPGGVQPGGQYL
jgi:hypothetical protein